MKLPIVFLAVLGLVCGKSLPTVTLEDDLKEFMELVPTEKILEITLDYLAYDHEVRDLIVYVQSEEFPIHKIHTIVEHLKEYEYCLKFINYYGVDVYAIITEVHDILFHLPPFHPTNTTRMGVGIYGLIDDVIAVLPLHELKTLFEKKVETREYFKALVTFIHSPIFMEMLDTLRSWPEYHELLEILQEKVVDVDHIVELFMKLYWRGTHSLHEDVKEFMELVPIHKVIHITLDYLAHDPELHKVFAYVQSEEFPKIHAIVEYLKEYKHCLKFIHDYGVDVHEFILEIHYILDLPPFLPTNTTRMGFGIYGLMDDVFALLPLEDLKTLFHTKMETREYIRTVVTTIYSPVFVDMLHTVRTLPEYHELLEKLREMGVDVEHIIKYFWLLFGLPHLF